jgi:hypothetical protein
VVANNFPLCERIESLIHTPLFEKEELGGDFLNKYPLPPFFKAGSYF